SDWLAPGVNEPRIAKPSTASFASAASTSASGSAIESASAPVLTGPSPSRRLRTTSIRALSADHERAANSAGAGTGGECCAGGDTEANWGRRSAAIHNAVSLVVATVVVEGAMVRRVTRLAPASVARNAFH